MMLVTFYSLAAPRSEEVFCEGRASSLGPSPRFYELDSSLDLSIHREMVESLLSEEQTERLRADMDQEWEWQQLNGLHTESRRLLLFPDLNDDSPSSSPARPDPEWLRRIALSASTRSGPSIDLQWFSRVLETGRPLEGDPAELEALRTRIPEEGLDLLLEGVREKVQLFVVQNNLRAATPDAFREDSPEQTLLKQLAELLQPIDLDTSLFILEKALGIS